MRARIALVGALFLLVLLAGVLPQTRPPTYLGLNLVTHVLAFFVLTLVTHAALRSLAVSAAAVFSLSVLIEVVQALTPHRVGSLLDVGVNAIGVAAAVALVLLLRRVS